MSADIISDKELSALLKLAAAALECSGEEVEASELIDSLDRAAAALDARRGVAK